MDNQKASLSLQNPRFRGQNNEYIYIYIYDFEISKIQLTCVQYIGPQSYKLKLSDKNSARFLVFFIRATLVCNTV